MIKLEKRGYQLKLTNQIKKAARNGYNVILELDAGLGKRITSYLLYPRLSTDERALMITPTTSSLEDTVSTFTELKDRENANLDDFGYIYGRTRSKHRKKLLVESKFLVCTPITLTHTLKKIEDNCENPLDFDYIILNEVDKLVRRTAVRNTRSRRERISDDEGKEKGGPIEFQTAKHVKESTLQSRKPLFTYPWNYLKKKIPKNACIIGMSATLRDKHMVQEGKTGKFRQELKTIIEDFIPEQEVKVINMKSLLRSTDLNLYLPDNVTVVRPIGILDSKVQKITSAITEDMEDVKDAIFEKHSDLFKKQDFEHIKKGFSLLPKESPLRRKFFRLSILRKFVVASIPDHYRSFITRFSLKNRGDTLIDLVPEGSGKIEKIVELSKSWISNDKNVAVMVSYIKTALEIRRRLEKEVDVSLITGKTPNRKEILDSFKESKSSLLILTPVGERDLDLKCVDLLIVHDIVNTVKTVYQRLKRARGSMVVFLYYKDTHEKLKLFSVFDKIRKRYPWTTQIAT